MGTYQDYVPPSSAGATALTAADLAMYASPRIGPELLAKAHICRVTNAQARGTFGIKFDTTKDLSGICYPYLSVKTGMRVTARVRRDHPDIDVDGKVKNKYLSPYGDSKHLYFPPGAAAKLVQADTPVVLVEAEKSVLALHAWAERTGTNILPLAMGGCWGWRTSRACKEVTPSGERVDVHGPVADLAYCNGHKVYVTLDNNVSTNPDVAAAQRALIAELRKRECQVLVCDLPIVDGVNGPDDYIAVAGDDAMAKVFVAVHPPTTTTNAVNTWPKPEPLGAELPPVPMFDAGLLPDALRPWCTDISERMQVPLDFPAVAAVAAMGAAVMRRAELQPKALDSTWTEYPNLWGAIVSA